MTFKRCTLSVFLPLLLSLLMGCSGSDSTGSSSNLLTGDDHQVFLIAQTASPAGIPDAGSETEANRLLATRQWVYEVDWNVNDYLSTNDTMTFLKTENGIPTAIGTLRVAYLSSGDEHFVFLIRQSGSLSMDDLNLTITSGFFPVDLSLDGSGEDYRMYHFTKEDLRPFELQHRLSLSNLDILEADKLQFQYDPQVGPVLEFASPLQAVLTRNDSFSIECIDTIGCNGSLSNPPLPRTLEQHLNTFLTVLFSGADKTHVFSLEVQGQKLIIPAPNSPSIVTSIPLILITAAKSSDLDTIVPAVASSLKTRITETDANFDRLQLKVNVFDDSVTPVLTLTLTDLFLDMKQVSDVE